MIDLAAICCLRRSELAALHISDTWFDFHTGYGIPGYQGTAAVHIGRRKNANGSANTPPSAVIASST
jgi:hypothetical protein